MFVMCGCSSMVEHQPSKLVVRVRFPSPAPSFELNIIEGIVEEKKWLRKKSLKEINPIVI